MVDLKLLQQIVMQSPTGAAIYNFKNNSFLPIYENDKVLEMIGNDRTENKSILKIKERVHPEDRKKVENYINELFSEKHSAICTYRYLNKKTNTYVHLVNTGISFVGTDGHQNAFVNFFDITKDVNIREKLEKEIEKTNTILNMANIIVWEYDLATDTCIWKSSNLANNVPVITFKDVSKISADNASVCKETADEYYHMFKSIRDGEKSYEGRLHVIMPNGTETWQRIILHTEFSKDGKPIGAVGYSMDITGYVKNEQRYESELKYIDEVHNENLVDKGRFNISKNILESYTSNYGKNLVEVGVSYDECLKILSSAMVSKNQIDEMYKKFNREVCINNYAIGIDHISFEYLRIIDKNKPPIWCQMTIKFFENPKTQELFAFLYSYNVNVQTVLKNTAGQLFSNDYEAIGVIDIISKEMYLIKKPNIKLLMEDTERFSYTDKINSMIDEYVPENEKHAARDELNISYISKKLEKSPKYSCSFSLIINGEFHRVQWDFINFSEKNGAIIYTRSDITDLFVRTHKQQTELSQALVKAEKASAAKTEFLSTMSHDIRTPLNAIINMARLARDDYSGSSDGDVMDDIDKIESASAYLKSLIDDILDVSRIENGKLELHPEVYNFKEFLYYFNSVFTPLAKSKNIDLTWDNGPTDIPLYVDKLRMNQIFSNIISNAIKYTYSGGKIICSITDNKIEDGCLSCNYIVEDNGRGISKEFQKVMFKPFERECHTNENNVGTGLGLSIVKSIVDIMNGTIVVDSEVGRGTKVTITLKIPIATKEQLADLQQLEESDYNNSILEGKKILVAEDNSLNMTIIQRLLKHEGLIVTSTWTGREVLNTFKESKPGDFDMILMDIRMPEMDGLTATREIRKLDREDAKTIPIIAMTADAFSEDKRESRNAGMNNHISKPIEPQLLYATMQYYLK